MCKYCNGSEETIMYTSDSNSIYIGKNNKGKYCLINSDSYDGNEMEIEYCPMCGSRLSDYSKINKSQDYKLKYIQTLLDETGNKCGVQIYSRDIYVFSIEIEYYDGKTFVSKSYWIKDFDELNPNVIVKDLLDNFEVEKKKNEWKYN